MCIRDRGAGRTSRPLLRCVPDFQCVPDAAHGAYQVRTELAPQRLHVAVDGPGARGIGPAPHLRQEGLTAEHGARPCRETRQQVKLGRRQVHLVGVGPHPTRGPVDAQTVDVDVGCRSGCGAGAFDPAEQCPDPRDELPHREGLGHVVVRADAQPHEEVDLVVAGCEHQHGDRPIRLEAPAHLVSVKTGQHDVEHHQLGVPRGSPFEGCEPVMHLVDGEALSLQARGDGLGDGSLVLDDQDAGFCGSPLERRERLGGCGADAVKVRCRSARLRARVRPVGVAALTSTARRSRFRSAAVPRCRRSAECHFLARSRSKIVKQTFQNSLRASQNWGTRNYAYVVSPQVRGVVPIRHVRAGHESVSGEPTGWSHAPATALRTTRGAPPHVTRIVLITLTCPDASIQTETLRDTRDIRGQALGQSAYHPGHAKGPPTTVGEPLTCGYTADGLVAGDPANLRSRRCGTWGSRLISHLPGHLPTLHSVFAGHVSSEAEVKDKAVISSPVPMATWCRCPPTPALTTEWWCCWSRRQSSRTFTPTAATTRVGRSNPHPSTAPSSA